MEKETVRTRVMLASGDQMPAKEKDRQPGNRAMRTGMCEEGETYRARTHGRLRCGMCGGRSR
jgi:hypothetical protein